MTPGTLGFELKTPVIGRANELSCRSIATQATSGKMLLREPMVVADYGVPEDPRDIPASNTVLLLHSKSASSPAAASQSLTSTDFVVTLDRLRALKKDDDEDDRPSKPAYELTFQLLREVAGDLGFRFPRAVASTGPGQGIRLLWAKNERELRVTIGGSPMNKTYLYWLAPGRSGVEPKLDRQTLHQYLAWLTEEI